MKGGREKNSEEKKMSNRAEGDYAQCRRIALAVEERLPKGELIRGVEKRKKGFL